ncbi:hypothetical protein OROMI_027070 [Orobanche minor]
MECDCSTSKGEEIVHVEFMAQQKEKENTFEMGTDKKEEVQVTEDAYVCIDNEGNFPPIKYPMEYHEQESLLFRNDSSDMKIIKDPSVLDFEDDIFMKGVKFNEFENKRVVVGEFRKKEVLASCRGMNDASPRLIWMVAWIFIVSLNGFSLTEIEGMHFRNLAIANGMNNLIAEEISYDIDEMIELHSHLYLCLTDEQGSMNIMDAVDSGNDEYYGCSRFW